LTDLRLPRGLRDYSPEEYELLLEVRRAFEEEAALHGFRMMEPSSLELLSTLEAKSGPGIREEIYNFVDKGGREVGLRFDLTVGLTRYYCSDRSLPKDTRLAAFADVWRYDEPQRGRYRWFYQWDVEIFGPRSPLADAEIVAFSHDLLRRLGVEAEFVLNDRKLTESMIVEASGGRADAGAVEDALRALDKLDRRRREEVLEEYASKGHDPSVLEEVMRRAESGDYELTERLSAVVSILEGVGVPHRVDPRLARGLDYYESFVFEARSRERPELGSLVGGGRYDVLTRIFGRPDSGATGAGGGVDRTIDALRARGSRAAPRPAVAIVYPSGSEGYALRVAEALRGGGIPAHLPLHDGEVGMQAAFREASAKYEVLVIAGPREASNGTVRLKLGPGEELVVPLREAAAELSSRLARGRSP
jgi:histidyl-tRNA synthetase